jgi:hypothetical protein
MIKYYVCPVGLFFSFISLSILTSQVAFAGNNIKQIDKTPASNLVSERGITLDVLPEERQQYIPETKQTNLPTPNKTVEQSSPNRWYSAIDFGTNAVYVTNGRETITSSSGYQATGKVGYSMNGPRVELESSIGSIRGGAGSFSGTGVNAYYDFQIGSTRPYIGIGYGFGTASSSGGSTSGSIVQSKLGISFDSSPDNNFYVELKAVQPTDSNSVGIASFNFGNTFKF